MDIVVVAVVIISDGVVVLFNGEGAEAEVPVVVPVLDLEVLHQGPVVVFVALGELLEVVGTAVEELLAREVGGA
jgi:hypothetical protein